jgi:hypothetical protein
MTTGIGAIGTELKIATGPFGRTAIDIRYGHEIIGVDSLDQTSAYVYSGMSGRFFTGGPACRADWDIKLKTWLSVPGVTGLKSSRVYVPTVAALPLGGVMMNRSGTKEVDLAEKGKKHQQGQVLTVLEPTGKMTSYFFSVTTGLGRIAYDNAKGEIVAMSKDCTWYKVNGSDGKILYKGSWSSMKTGEKFDFLIVPRPSAASVWHCALNGYSTQSSRYQNSLRVSQKLPPVTWATYSSYPAQGDDMNHIGLGQYPARPRGAIIGGVFGGKFMVNIWNGRQMTVSPAGLICIGEADQEQRHGPHFATTYDSTGSARTWAVWKNDGKIMLTDVMEAVKNGGGGKVVATGSFPAIAADGAAGLALVYTRDNALYRRTIAVD